jgi:predicted glutamine amidotransferase
MCRLFALHAGTRPARATFWLLDAPDSLVRQSHREPDGAGIGVFDRAGSPVVAKQPIAAYQDADFAREARGLSSTTFLAHVRYASTGALSVENTHPFCQDGRLFAHNGAFDGLDSLDARLVELHADALVEGQTDSERMFALITAETRRHDGDVGQGLVAAVTWIARRLPAYSLNLVVTTAEDIWALRYPDTNELYVLERSAGRPDATGRLDAVSPRITARSDDLADAPSVVVASEPMDDDPGWRLLEDGELLHIDAGLVTTSSHPLPERLSHPLTLSDLAPAAASSQRPTGGATTADQS